MADNQERRIDRVAEVILRAKFDGAVTLVSIMAKYGKHEFEVAQARYRQEAKEFLAMYDAVKDFDENGDPDFREVGERNG